ncbi:DUF4221 family protein [Algoriphagus pacificus]|uniref:DUF4221 family protein n=1 Tax=Algoriphagus pacificus TaxID=2811234 RepID=A0ABS3CB97_9BACT|nr:DUF4221 family protein [Algoriphagus pacificus]MBN7814338.1 DUF4221 family protein [Algoriphagus pacificus]
MRKVLTICILGLLSACTGKESENSEPKNILENLSYSVDTVVVDSKGEIINLKYGMNWFDLSPDSRSLFIYDYNQTLFQEIDLDKMVLSNTYQFEKEGPNGLGRSSNFQVLPDGTLMIPTFPNSGIYNLQGEILSRINLNPEDIKGVDAPNPFALIYEILFDPKTEILYSLPGDFINGVRDLAVIDSKTQKGRIVKLPKMEKAENFKIFWNSDTGGSIQTENYTLEQIDDKLLITCTVGSGIYVFDTKTDSLSYVDFPHQLIPREKTGEIQNEVSTEEDFFQELRKVLSQVSFQELIWDEHSSRFYRLAIKSFVAEKKGDPTTYETYLLAYDKDLKLLGESKIEGLDQRLSNYFWKDGKLWSYVNVEDELGFAVFTFNF